MIRTLVMIVSVIFWGDSTSQARVWYSGNDRAAGYQLELIGISSPLRSYRFRGDVYVEGQVGVRYVVRIHNHTSRRVEAVISVDGRDAIDGEPSGWSKRGYVIEAYSFVDVDGFRISMEEVAAFRFTRVPDSYASRMGTPWEVGNVQVALFPERIRRPIRRPQPSYVPNRGRKAQRSLQAFDAGSTSQNLGTEFGERRTSRVTQTHFLRQNWNQPVAQLSIRYDDRTGLCTLGILSRCYSLRPVPAPRPPSIPPFERNDGFAKPPAGWDHFSPWY